jgi:hypothetical protein
VTHPLRPIRPAYAQWLGCRVTILRQFHQEGRLDDVRSLAAELAESARSMGYQEVEAATFAVSRLVGNPALDAAIEILRRIAKRAGRSVKRDAA